MFLSTAVSNAGTPLLTEGTAAIPARIRPGSTLATNPDKRFGTRLGGMVATTWPSLKLEAVNVDSYRVWIWIPSRLRTLVVLKPSLKVS